MATSVPEPIRGTVFVGRKLSDRQYGTYEFGVHLPVEFSQEISPSEQTDAVVAAFKQAQEIIAGQTSPILATLVEAQVAAPAGKAASTSDASDPKAKHEAASQELKDGQVLKPCKETSVEVPHWDNRENKRNPKAPDFKCSVCGAGIWPPKK